MHFNNTSFGILPYVKQVVWLTLVTAVVALAVVCVRLFSLVHFNADINIVNADFWRVLWQGLRFDVATSIRLFFPVYLLSFFAVLLPAFIGRCALWLGLVWGSAVAVCVVLLSVANVGYIAFFGTPFNASAIESLSYDNHAIAESVWGSGSFLGYGLASLLASTIIAVVCYKMAKWLIVRWVGVKLGVMVSTGFVLISLVLVLSLGRGSFGNFPLSHKHLIVSASPTYNNAVPNGALAVYYAVLEYLDSRSLTPANDAEGRMLYQAFYGHEPKKGSLWPQLFVSTPKVELLADKPPHVVLNLLESLGNEPLTAEFGDQVDLLGELKGHLQQDYWFQHFLPAYNDTQSSLVAMLGNINYPTITQSKYKQVSLDTAAAKVFQRKGYKTVFIYTGYEGIRHRSDFLLNQGFDEVIGAHQLLQQYPQMPTNVWGGEDAYMYDYAANLMLQHGIDKQPLFVVTLTTTNHSPYKVPSSFIGNEPVVDSNLKSKLGSLPDQSLATFKYTNVHLGRFISRIKASDIAESTIIAATGDHAVRGLAGFKGSVLRNLAVPFYLYVPNSYKPNMPVDLEQVASHKDIMPTLYQLSLSEAIYPNVGRNILAPIELGSPHDFATSDRYIVTKKGARLKTKPDVFYPLLIGHGLTLGPSVTETSFTSAQVYDNLVDWMMRKQLVGEGLAGITGDD
jgi:phosphoglycerol transferase MdoB-like AlkP superfamily enzyme